MAMTIIVTRDVAPRTRGFLSSVMPEPAPGLYASPALTRGVRERIWSVLSDWHDVTGKGSVVLIWKDDKVAGGMSILTLGTPPRRLTDLDGVLVSRW